MESAALPATPRSQAAARAPAWPARAPLSRWVWALAASQAALLLATSARYGYHRDELYFIVAGSHPALGYPDQPPLVPLVCWAMNALAPGSLPLLRAPSALAAAGTAVLSGAIAREAGGKAQAQAIAAACTAASAIALATGHFVTTTTFDVLGTTALAWLAVRGVARNSGASLLAAGVVVGVGAEAKPQIGLAAAVMLAALIGAGPRAPLRSNWMAGGVFAAVLLAAPYVLWQHAHGWPQLTVAGNIAGTQEGGRVGFIPFQLVLVSPLLVPVWAAGLIAPFRRARWRALRFLPLSYATLALLYLAGNGHAYYLASLYPALLGLGAVPASQWAGRARKRAWALASAIALSAAASALIALPLLPARDLQGSVVMALNPAQGETVGWPRFVRAVAIAWRAIPATARSRTAIFTANYGEAGAIDLMGPALGLPRAYSAHNGFAEWGRPPDSDTSVLLVGYESQADAAPRFGGCEPLARVDDRVGLRNQEQGLPVMLCHPAATWAALWPRLRHYD